MSNPPSRIEIYTDGSCLKNPDGPGGWAAVCVCPDGSRIEMYDSSTSTTNNRMEMYAAVEAARLIKNHFIAENVESFTIYTDSEYVKKGITEWMPGWKRRGWRTAQGDPVKNQDMWQLLDAETQGLNIEWRWVRGHAEHPLNERADELAGMAARTQTRAIRKVSAEEVEDEQLARDADPKKRAGPIELDVTLTDSQLAAQVRAMMAAANGKIVRFREMDVQTQQHTEHLRPTPTRF